MKDNASFVEGLLRVVPELRPVYDRHLADNDTLLPHVFMGDVTRFAVAETADATGQAALARLMGYLEDGLKGGGEEVKELISASFVENLLGEKAALQRLKSLMGPSLTKKVEAICGRDPI
jgi:hypothetical protein